QRQLDSLLAVEVVLVDRQLVLRGLAEPQVLGERRTVVGRMVLAPDHQDRAVRIVGADALDRRGAGEASAYDDVVVPHGLRPLIGRDWIAASLLGAASLGLRRSRSKDSRRLEAVTQVPVKLSPEYFPRRSELDVHLFFREGAKPCSFAGFRSVLPRSS